MRARLRTNIYRALAFYNLLGKSIYFVSLLPVIEYIVIFLVQIIMVSVKVVIIHGEPSSHTTFFGCRKEIKINVLK